MGLIVGAYAASPAHAVWDPAFEGEFFAGLDGLSGIRGLELPWLGSVHPHDDAWLLDNVPRRFENVVTDIGATVGVLSHDRGFGLASNDPDGRSAAIAMARRLCDDVRRIVDGVGPASVLAVELHSAPLAHSGSADALAASLAEVASWDWAGTTLVVEHCDAEVAGQLPEKGYLSLEAELRAIRLSGADIGVSLNWGRSVIELRDAQRVVEHIDAVVDAGVLRGLIFSGAAATACAFGPAWIDAHLPPAPSAHFPSGERASLLTFDHVREGIGRAGPIDWLGFKFGVRPESAGVEERIAMVASAVHAMENGPYIGCGSLDSRA